MCGTRGTQEIVVIIKKKDDYGQNEILLVVIKTLKMSYQSN